MIDVEEPLGAAPGRPLYAATSGLATPAHEAPWTGHEQPRALECQARSGVIRGAQHDSDVPGHLLGLKDLVPAMDGGDQQLAGQAYPAVRRDSNLMLELLEQFHQVHQHNQPRQHELGAAGELVARTQAPGQHVPSAFESPNQRLGHELPRQYQQPGVWFDEASQHTANYPLLHQQLGSQAVHPQCSSTSEQQQLHRHRFHAHNQLVAPGAQPSPHVHHYPSQATCYAREDTDSYLGQYLNPDARGPPASSRELQWLVSDELEPAPERGLSHEQHQLISDQTPADASHFYDTYRHFSSPRRSSELGAGNFHELAGEERPDLQANTQQHLQRDHDSTRWFNLDRPEAGGLTQVDASGQPVNLLHAADLCPCHNRAALADQTQDLHYLQFGPETGDYHTSEHRNQTAADYQALGQLNGYRPSVIQGETDLQRQPTDQAPSSSTGGHEGALFATYDRLGQHEPCGQLTTAVDVPNVLELTSSAGAEQQSCESVHYTMMEADETSNKTYHLLDAQPQRLSADLGCLFPQAQQEQQDFADLTCLGKGGAVERAPNTLDGYSHQQLMGEQSSTATSVPIVSRYYDPSIEINITNLLDTSQQDSDSSDGQSTSGASGAGAASSTNRSRYGLKLAQSPGCSPETLEKLRAFLKRKMRDTKRDSLEVSSSSSMSSTSSPLAGLNGNLQPAGQHVRLNQPEPIAACSLSSSSAYPSMLRQSGWCDPIGQTGLDGYHSMQAASSCTPGELVADSALGLMDHQVHQGAVGSSSPDAISKAHSESGRPGSERALSTGYLIETRSSKRRRCDRSDGLPG